MGCGEGKQSDASCGEGCVLVRVAARCRGTPEQRAGPEEASAPRYLKNMPWETVRGPLIHPQATTDMDT